MFPLDSNFLPNCCFGSCLAALRAVKAKVSSQKPNINRITNTDFVLTKNNHKINNFFHIEFVGEVNFGLTKDKVHRDTFSNTHLFYFC